MRSLSLPACLLLLLSGCAVRQARISGELLGADSSELPHAEVFLSRLDGTFARPLVSTRASSEGRFSLEPPGPGEYLLWLTAPGYPPQDLYVQVLPDAPSPSFQATLAPYPYRERIEKPAVIGSWSGYSFEVAEPMQLQADGTWLFERPVAGDSVTYQLVGLTPDGSSVPGTQADGYELDRSGDYQCLVQTQGGRVRIVFDPRKLPRQREAQPLRAVFKSPHEHLNPLNALHIEAATQAARTLAEFRAEMGSHTLPELDHTALHGKLLAVARDPGHSAMLRQLAALELLRLPFDDPRQYHRGAEGEAVAAELLQLLPVESPRWALATQGVARLVALTAEPAREQLLSDFASRNPEPGVRASALFALIGRARKAGDTERVAALVEQLEPYASSVTWVQKAIDLFRTDRKVARGQPAPDFSAELLDGQGPVSRQRLLGRFYLIDFWAVWCKPCVAEQPRLHAAWERFQGRGGFTILSVSMDGSVEPVKWFRGEKWKMPWLHTFCGKDFDAPLARTFEVQSLPTAILVDAQGTIIALNEELRGEQLERTLEALLPPKAGL